MIMLHYQEMKSRFTIVLLILFVCTTGHAAATSYVEDIVVSPETPAVSPGSAMNLTCSILLSSSGAQTFVPGHTLVLSTGLDRSSITMQVYVDRRPAAFLPGTGPIVFVNGYLLAYPSSQDVSVAVAMSGLVPADASGTVTVLRIEELDNSGIIIPASVFEINRTISEPQTSPTPTVSPTFSVTRTETPPVTVPGTTAPAGLWTVIAGLALGLGMILMERRRDEG